MKRRKLSTEQEVVIIYDVNIGFIEEPARFLEYRSLSVGDNVHSVPIFSYRDKEITGIECFWLLLSEARSADAIHRLQYELIQTQMVVSQIAKEKGYTIPQKIKSKEIEQMAEAKVNRKAAMIQKFGFDPMDEVWVEGELASTTREKRWFKFERENKLIFVDNWDEIVAKFNTSHNENLTIEDAKGLSKKRMRYILGAHNIRYSGDKDKKKWVTEARLFEQMHRQRENRMITWTNAHLKHFPLVKVKKPVRFVPGTYFNECAEKAPSVFTDVGCQHVKKGIVLRVVSYDPQDHYIRLDFTEDIRKLIKGEEQSPRPWIKEGLDYDFWVKPNEVEDQLDPLEPLDTCQSVRVSATATSLQAARMDRYVIAIKRSQRRTAPADWVEALRAIPDLTVRGEAGPCGVQVDATPAAIEEVHRRLGAWCHIEKNISHRFR